METKLEIKTIISIEDIVSVYVTEAPNENLPSITVAYVLKQNGLAEKITFFEKAPVIPIFCSMHVKFLSALIEAMKSK